MRRKRGNRGTWMPLNGHIEQGDNSEFAYSDQIVLSDGTTQVLQDGENGGIQIPPRIVIPDFTPEESAVSGNLAASLHDRVSGNAWLLQRIVGKIFVQCHDNQGITADPNEIWSNILVTAGFFVARAKDDGINEPDLTLTESDPTQVDNAMNPWIWRRSWILANPFLANANPGNAHFPRTNADYGSMSDGPHIDSKSKRLIQREHRLFFTMIARGYDGVRLGVASDVTQQPSFSALADLRVYGQLRGGHQKNASF